MIIDKFGRCSSSHKFNNNLNKKQNRFFGFDLTSTGNFDFQQKRICNISTPTEPNDAVTKSYVDEKTKQIASLRNELRFHLNAMRKDLKDLKASTTTTAAPAPAAASANSSPVLPSIPSSSKKKS